MTEKTKMTHTPAGAPDLKQSEVADAKKEGVIEYVKDGAKASMAADTGTTGETDDGPSLLVARDLNTTFIAPLLDLSLDDLTTRLKSKKDDAIGFEIAKGLLALERSARNRTGYVKALCSAIGVKSPFEVTSAGPAYTNDESSVSAL